MAIITLTTDLGNVDYYVAALKGRIVSENPNINIVDISHDIPKFDHYKAAYIVREASKYFPVKTVHVVGVVNFKNNLHKLLVAHYRDQYFVCYDTGFFSLLLDEFTDATLFEIEVKSIFTNTLTPFEELIDVALKIASGKPLPVFATEVHTANRQVVWQAIKQPNAIHGNVIFVDGFENLITNITREMMEEFLSFKSFEIQLRSAKINYISKSYDDVEPGNLAAIINHSGRLEIAINQGKAAQLLGMELGHKVNIHFI